MTEEIITNGTNAFSEIVGKLGNITTEFVPYLIYIAIAVLGISLTINVVKYILNYLKSKTMNVFYYKEYTSRRTGKITGKNANGTPQYEIEISETRKRRKHPNWKYLTNKK